MPHDPRHYKSPRRTSRTLARTASALAIVAAITGGLAATRATIPHEQYGYPPANLIVVAEDGTSKDTGVAALAVPLEDISPWVYVAEEWLPSIAWSSTTKRFASGAGDSQQESARLAAWFAANAELGRSIPTGALLSGQPQSPLRDGDTVLRVDSAPVLSEIDARTMLMSADCTAGHQVRILRDGHKQTVSVPCDWVAAGVEILPVGSEPPPWTVPVLDGMRGSSAGLALTLAYMDALTSGSLTGGRHVAVTGEVAARPGAGRSQVRAVGSIPAKMQAARAADVDVIIVPASQEDLARLHAGTTPVVGVATVAQAVAYLCGTGGNSDACSRTSPTSLH